MVEVVGILGFKGSGKDTAGEYLVSQHGFTMDSFANPLKDVTSAIFGWERALLEGDTQESRTWREEPDVWWEEKLNWRSNPGSRLGRFTPRVALQVIGTDALRQHFDDGIWIKSLEARLRQYDRVVITDCRFPNECGLIGRHGGLVFRVKRGPEPKWFQIALGAAQGIPVCQMAMADNFPEVHISEYAWLKDLPEKVVDNDGTIEQLHGRVECLTRDHFKSL